MEIPEELKQEIEKQSQGIKSKEIIENAQTISERYRKNDGKGKRMLTKSAEALSYAISRMPSTYCAVYSALKHSLENYESEIKTSLDIGAGTGAATWAINELLNIDESKCLEKENVMINIGKNLMENTQLKEVKWEEFDILKNEITEKADIVVTSYMINELPESSNVIEKLWNATKKILLIIEPGTPTGFNNILKARKFLLEKGANILAPCSHQLECPIKENDWCSFYVRVARSGIHRLTKKGELNYEDEKFSYIAFSKTKVNKYQERILRHPQINQGYIKLKICTSNGIEERTISKKDGEIYKKSKKLDAGDILK